MNQINAVNTLISSYNTEVKKAAGEKEESSSVYDLVNRETDSNKAYASDLVNRETDSNKAYASDLVNRETDSNTSVINIVYQPKGSDEPVSGQKLLPEDKTERDDKMPEQMPDGIITEKEKRMNQLIELIKKLLGQEEAKTEPEPEVKPMDKEKVIGLLIKGKKIDIPENSTSKAPYGVEIKQDPASGQYYATKPDTPEFKAHDKAAEKAMAQWEKEHPEPEVSQYYHSDKAFCDAYRPRPSAHDKWAAERREAYKNFEKEYRASNPEYEAQAIYYEAKQQEANSKNSPLTLTGSTGIRKIAC